jgi:hypothetical protein
MATRNLHCPCGASFAGEHAQDAMELHQVEVHGQEPDALKSRVVELEKDLADAVAHISKLEGIIKTLRDQIPSA